MEQVLEKRSNLVLLTKGSELGREEMSCVEGGGYINYDSLVSQSKVFLALGIVNTALAVTAGIMAGIAFSKPFGFGLVAGIAFAASAVIVAVAATLAFSLGVRLW